MRKVLAAWKERDACIAREYGCGNEKNDKKRSGCGGDFGKGLVGFLSSTSTMNTWSGECPCVNATVHGEVRITPDGGLTFKGSGAWAEWPVGAQGPNLPYHFADKNFTLMASVSIREVPKAGSSIPLTGVKLNDTGHKVLFCLSYTKKNKWEVTFNGNTRNLSGDRNRERGRKYRVALGMDYYVKHLVVYVDGSMVCDSEKDY
ncbi:trans-sialidase, putative [Trypanosoma cruzi]|nr:trans-sialidase, putative [Trypanosoma cruzi]